MITGGAAATGDNLRAMAERAQRGSFYFAEAAFPSQAEYFSYGLLFLCFHIIVQIGKGEPGQPRQLPAGIRFARAHKPYEEYWLRYHCCCIAGKDKQGLLKLGGILIFSPKIENMDRRNFLYSAGLGTSAFLAAPFAERPLSPNAAFNLNYAPHLGMFESLAGGDPIAQIHFMADQGFRGFEDNEMKKRPLALQEAIAKALLDRGMQMGVFVAHTIFWDEPCLASADSARHEQFLAEVKESVEVAKRVNATWMTVVPGHLDLRQDMGYQTSRVVETLKRAADILAPHGLVMVLEPLNFRDHPGQFLTKAAQAFQICQAVGSPACKILFDVYHQQIQEGNILPNLEACWGEVAYIQVGDNPGRKEPTTGEVNFLNVFKYLHEKGYGGIIGMEHGSSGEGEEGERAVIAAYQQVDGFLPKED